MARYRFLDQYRGLVVFLVIVLHVALCYMAGTPEWWYVIAPERSPFYGALVLLSDVFIMPGMFFVAGFFSLPTYRKRGAVGFVKAKAFRIGLPWTIGVLVFAPITAGFIPLSRGMEMGIGEFLALFWGPYFQQAHYWFLGVLLLFHLLLVLVLRCAPGCSNRAPSPEHPGPGFHLKVVGIGTLWMGGALHFFPPDFWFMGWKVLVFQPERIGILLLCFLLGIHAERNHWFEEGGYVPSPFPWALWLGWSAITYLMWRYMVQGGPSTVVQRLLQGFFFMFYCHAGILGPISLFFRFERKERPSRFGLRSYGTYYVHMPITFFIAWRVMPMELGVHPKFLMTLALATGISLAVSEGLHRLPGMRRIF